MQKQYETVFIMTPVLSDEQMKETVSKFRRFLKENKAEIIYEDDWGLRKLTYPIQKKSTGFYHLIEFKAESELVAKFELELRRDERIIRFLTVALDRHAIAYNQKKRMEKEKADEKSDKKAEEKVKKEAEEKGVKKAEEKTEKEAEEKGVKKAEEKTEKEAEEKGVKKAEEKTEKEAEEKGVKKAEEKTEKEAEEKAAEKEKK